MNQQNVEKPLQEVLAGSIASHYVSPLQSQPDGRALLPGSFDPLHHGHLAMARVAEGMLGAQVEFELAAINVDKQPLDTATIFARVQQFSRHGVHITRAARFVEKARLFNNATFIVGADTILRVGDVRYYNNDQGQHQAAIEEITAHGCRFLVFGRLLENGFAEPGELRLPVELAAICDGVAGEQFRNDISSTQLRNSEDPSGARDG